MRSTNQTHTSQSPCRSAEHHHPVKLHNRPTCDTPSTLLDIKYRLFNTFVRCLSARTAQLASLEFRWPIGLTEIIFSAFSYYVKKRYCTHFVIIYMHVCPPKFPPAGPIDISFRFQKHHNEKMRSVRLTAVSADQFFFVSFLFHHTPSCLIHQLFAVLS